MMRLAPTLSFNTAKFYLEMNQWNVQAAVCSYFDLETANTLPGMVFLQVSLLSNYSTTVRHDFLRM